jgi:hypothetical protein
LEPIRSVLCLGCKGKCCLIQTSIHWYYAWVSPSDIRFNQNIPLFTKKGLFWTFCAFPFRFMSWCMNKHSEPTKCVIQWYITNPLAVASLQNKQYNEGEISHQFTFAKYSWNLLF